MGQCGPPGRSLSRSLQHEATRSNSTPPWMGCQSIAGLSPSIKFAGTHLYTWVERDTVRVKCLAQEHNTMSRPGLEPRPLAPESSALTMRPPHLPQIKSLRQVKSNAHSHKLMQGQVSMAEFKCWPRKQQQFYLPIVAFSPTKNRLL